MLLPPSATRVNSACREAHDCLGPMLPWLVPTPAYHHGPRNHRQPQVHMCPCLGPELLDHTAQTPVDQHYLQSLLQSWPWWGTCWLECMDAASLTGESACRHVLANASNRSLILIDELGKGTEATAGAALCAAQLEDLESKGALGIFATCARWSPASMTLPHASPVLCCALACGLFPVLQYPASSSDHVKSMRLFCASSASAEPPGWLNLGAVWGQAPASSPEAEDGRSAHAVHADGD